MIPSYCQEIQFVMFSTLIVTSMSATPRSEDLHDERDEDLFPIDTKSFCSRHYVYLFLLTDLEKISRSSPWLFQ